jgi:hypothetical protein
LAISRWMTGWTTPGAATSRGEIPAQVVEVPQMAELLTIQKLTGQVPLSFPMVVHCVARAVSKPARTR